MAVLTLTHTHCNFSLINGTFFLFLKFLAAARKIFANAIAYTPKENSKSKNKTKGKNSNAANNNKPDDKKPKWIKRGEDEKGGGVNVGGTKKKTKPERERERAGARARCKGKRRHHSGFLHKNV